MSCTQAQAAIAGFDPAGAALLDDGTAVHLDGCPACRAAFDARFVPIEVGRAPPIALAVPRRRLPVGWVAAAAAVLWMAAAPAPGVPDGDGLTAADDPPSECLVDEPWRDHGVCDV